LRPSQGLLDEILGTLIGGGYFWCFLAIFMVEDLQLGFKLDILGEVSTKSAFLYCE
jgi:hypothetical protein